jgi:hypothetical protein
VTYAIEVFWVDVTLLDAAANLLLYLWVIAEAPVASVTYTVVMCKSVRLTPSRRTRQ